MVATETGMASVREPWQEQPRGRPAPLSLVRLPGVEQLQAFLDGRAPDPPVARLTGRRLAAADVGTATYVMPMTEWLTGPRGRVHGGALAFLADAALLAATQSALPPRTLCTTAELSMAFLGAMPTGGGVLTARGQVVHVDERNALSEVFVTESSGRLVAHGTSRLFVFPPLPEDVELPDGDTKPDPVYAEPDPYLRPVDREPGDDEPPSAGLAALQAVRDGRRRRLPIDRLVGIRITAADEGEVTFELTPSGWLLNELGTVYGGVIGMLAKSACSAVVQSVAPDGADVSALDVKVNYVRAADVTGPPIVATGMLAHRGRQLAIARVEVMQGDRRIALATGSTQLSVPDA